MFQRRAVKYFLVIENVYILMLHVLCGILFMYDTYTVRIYVHYYAIFVWNFYAWYVSSTHLRFLLRHFFQVANDDNPRRLLRRGNCAFSMMYKQLCDSIFSARLFLTAALHEPIMRLLMEEEWFYDIDPSKVPHCWNTWLKTPSWSVLPVPHWATADAKLKVPFMANPELAKVLPSESGVGQIVATYASPAARNVYLTGSFNFSFVLQTLTWLFNCLNCS